MIAPPGEPGDRLVLTGTLSDDRGRPLPGRLVLAYHQNAQGVYVPGLRASLRTGPGGEFRIHTIVPGRIVAGGEPPHLHFEVESGGERQVLTTYLMLGGTPGSSAEPPRSGPPSLVDHPPPLFPDPVKAQGAGLVPLGGVRTVRDSTGTWRATTSLVVK